MANILDASAIEYTVLKNPQYFYKTLLKSKMIEGGYVRVMPHVVKDTFVKSIAMTQNTVLQADARDCGWEPVERFTLDGKIMSVKNYKSDNEICLETLDNLYSEMLFSSKGAVADQFPTVQGEGQSLESVIMFHLQNALGADIDRLIIGGEGNAVAGVQEGLIDKALADAKTIKVANGVTLDASNVLDEIKRVYDAIPDSLIALNEFEPEAAKVSIFVDLTTYRYIKQALNTTATNYQVTLPSYTYDGGKVYYMGLEIVPVGYMPKNTMLVFSRDNVVVLTDLLEDTTRIDAEQGKTIKDRGMWYAKMQLRFGVDYIFSDEIVIYQKA